MDPLATRVAARFVQALGSPDALLHKTEAAAHRSAEMLHAVAQQHKFWMSSVASGKWDEVARAHGKLLTLLKTFEHETYEAMGNLEQYEEATREDVVDYPDSFER